MAANTTDVQCQDRVKPGQCSAWVGSLYAFIYMQMYFCIFPYRCYSTWVSAARAVHGARTSLAPPLLMHPATCTSTCTRCVCCVQAACSVGSSVPGPLAACEHGGRGCVPTAPLPAHWHGLSLPRCTWGRSLHIQQC